MVIKNISQNEIIILTKTLKPGETMVISDEDLKKEWVINQISALAMTGMIREYRPEEEYKAEDSSQSQGETIEQKPKKKKETKETE